MMSEWSVDEEVRSVICGRGGTEYARAGMRLVYLRLIQSVTHDG